MDATRENTWSRLGLEFVVVVVGILAALAVDDWRQGREDRSSEQHLLGSLIQDLESDSSDVVRQAEIGRRNIREADQLLALVGYPLTTPVASDELDPAQIRKTLEDLSFLAEFEVTDGTYSEMIATGSFRVIENPETREAISDYYGRARVLARIPQRRVDARPEFLSALAAVGVVPEYADQQPDILERLRSDPQIPIQALRIRAFWEATLPGTGLRSLGQLDEQRGELLGALRAALERFD